MIKRKHKNPLDLKGQIVSKGLNLNDIPKKRVDLDQNYKFQVMNEKSLIEQVNHLYYKIQKNREHFSNSKRFTKKQIQCILNHYDNIDFSLHELKQRADLLTKQAEETGKPWSNRKTTYLFKWFKACNDDYNYINDSVQRYTCTLNPDKVIFKINPSFRKFGKLWEKNVPETEFVNGRFLDQNGDFFETVRPELIYKKIDENKLIVNCYLNDLARYVDYLESMKAWLYSHKMSLNLRKHFATILNNLLYDTTNLHLEIKKNDLTYLDFSSCMLLNDEEIDILSKNMDNIYDSIEILNNYFQTMPCSWWTQQYTIRSKDDFKILEKYSNSEYFFTAFSIFEENNASFLVQCLDFCFNINNFIYSALFCTLIYFSFKAINYFYSKIKFF